MVKRQLVNSNGIIAKKAQTLVTIVFFSLSLNISVALGYEQTLFQNYTDVHSARLGCSDYHYIYGLCGYQPLPIQNESEGVLYF